MAWWTEKSGNIFFDTARTVGNWFHAQPPEDAKAEWHKKLPAMHRLLNAGLMFAAFPVGGYVRDVLRGFDEKGKEIEAKDVPFPIRFLHGKLKHNPDSDLTSDKFKKVVGQLIPAVAGATGAIAGSVMFFRRNKREQMFGDTLKAAEKEKTGIGLLTADDGSVYAQSWPSRIAAGAFATFGSVSGLNFLYGLFLNRAFGDSSNRTMLTGISELTGWKWLNKLTGNTNADYRRPPEYIKKLSDEYKDGVTRITSKSKLVQTEITKDENYGLVWSTEKGVHQKTKKVVRTEFSYHIPEEEIQKETDLFAKRFVEGLIEPFYPDYVEQNRGKLLEKGKTFFKDKIWGEAMSDALKSAEHNFNFHPYKAPEVIKSNLESSGKRKLDTLLKDSRLGKKDEVGNIKSPYAANYEGDKLVLVLRNHFDIPVDVLAKPYIGNTGIQGKLNNKLLEISGFGHIPKNIQKGLDIRIRSLLDSTPVQVGGGRA